MRHLLSIEDLDRAAIERICDRAASFAEVAQREIKKVPALRGRTVLNLFYEASTLDRATRECRTSPTIQIEAPSMSPTRWRSV